MTEHEWTDDQIREFANLLETLAGKPPGEALLDFFSRFPFTSVANLERLVSRLVVRRNDLALAELQVGTVQ